MRQQKLITSELPQSFQVLTQAVLLQTDCFFFSLQAESREPHRRYKSEPWVGLNNTGTTLADSNKPHAALFFLQCKAQMKMRTDFMGGFYRHKLVAGISCERLS